jgi:hypothetical protein
MLAGNFSHRPSKHDCRGAKDDHAGPVMECRFGIYDLLRIAEEQALA